MDVHASEDYAGMRLNVYVSERVADGRLLRTQTGECIKVGNGESFPEPTWSIPFEMLEDLREAIGPATASMSDKLLEILDSERSRVDKLINHIIMRG